MTIATLSIALSGAIAAIVYFARKASLAVDKSNKADKFSRDCNAARIHAEVEFTQLSRHAMETASRHRAENERLRNSIHDARAAAIQDADAATLRLMLERALKGES